MSESVEDKETSAGSSPRELDQTARYASLLASGERVIVVRQRHWFTFVQAARWFVLVLAVGVLFEVLNGQLGDSGVSGVLSTGLGWGFLIFAVVGLGGLGWYFLEWQRERYLVTTRRVIEAGGVINKYSRDTSLPMITDMVVGHPWIGRILGYGEIDLLTASEAGTNKIRYLPDADGFKRALLDAKYEHELEVGGGRAARDDVSATAPPPASRDRLSADEVDASITRLADLRDRGLITAAEFDQKKQQILDRL
jgi:Short C-terminal domain/Bacterial PH domain